MSINLKYKPLVDVKVVRHANPAFELDDFKFHPTLRTDEIIKRYNLVLRKRDTGFTLFYKLNKLMPVTSQVIGKFVGPIQLLFVIQAKSFKGLKNYATSFPANEITNFFITNKMSSGIKPTASNLTINGFLNNDDKTSLKYINKTALEKVFQLKRAGDTSSFELNLKGRIDRPMAVLEIALEDTQDTVSNLNYIIKLN